MAYFAKLDDQGNVESVSVVADSIGDGAAFIQGIFGGTWVRCTKDTGRLQAGVGHKYLAEQEGFQSPQPFASWSFNEDEWQWEPPAPMPADNKPYVWNEDSAAWEELQ